MSMSIGATQTFLSQKLFGTKADALTELKNKGSVSSVITYTGFSGDGINLTAMLADPDHPNQKTELMASVMGPKVDIEAQLALLLLVARTEFSQADQKNRALAILAHKFASYAAVSGEAEERMYLTVKFLTVVMLELALSTGKKKEDIVASDFIDDVKKECAHIFSGVRTELGLVSNDSNNPIALSWVYEDHKTAIHHSIADTVETLLANSPCSATNHFGGRHFDFDAIAKRVMNFSAVTASSLSGAASDDDKQQRLTQEGPVTAVNDQMLLSGSSGNSGSSSHLRTPLFTETVVQFDDELSEVEYRLKAERKKREEEVRNNTARVSRMDDSDSDEGDLAGLETGAADETEELLGFILADPDLDAYVGTVDVEGDQQGLDNDIMKLIDEGNKRIGKEILKALKFFNAMSPNERELFEIRRKGFVDKIEESGDFEVNRDTLTVAIKKQTQDASAINPIREFFVERNKWIKAIFKYANSQETHKKIQQVCDAFCTEALVEDAKSPYKTSSLFTDRGLSPARSLLKWQFKINRRKFNAGPQADLGQTARRLNFFSEEEPTTRVDVAYLEELSDQVGPDSKERFDLALTRAKKYYELSLCKDMDYGNFLKKDQKNFEGIEQEISHLPSDNFLSYDEQNGLTQRLEQWVSTLKEKLMHTQQLFKQGIEILCEQNNQLMHPIKQHYDLLVCSDDWPAPYQAFVDSLNNLVLLLKEWRQLEIGVEDPLDSFGLRCQESDGDDITKKFFIYAACSYFQQKIMLLNRLQFNFQRDSQRDTLIRTPVRRRESSINNEGSSLLIRIREEFERSSALYAKTEEIERQKMQQKLEERLNRRRSRLVRSNQQQQQEIINNLKERLRQKKDERAQLESNLHQAFEDISKIETQNQSLIAKITELQARLDFATDSINEVVQHNRSLEEHNAAQKKDLLKLLQKLSEAEKDYELLRESNKEFIEGYKKRIEELNDKLAQVKRPSVDKDTDTESDAESGSEAGTLRRVSRLRHDSLSEREEVFGQEVKQVASKFVIEAAQLRARFNEAMSQKEDEISQLQDKLKKVEAFGHNLVEVNQCLTKEIEALKRTMASLVSVEKY